MPVPTSISDLSTNPVANSPQGSESAKGTIDDYLRSHAAFIAQLSALVAGSTVSLASGATVAIGAAASLNVAITGTTTITAFDTVPEGTLRWVAFAGALTLTHNAANLQLPGAANVQTAAGDSALFKSLGGGAWKCVLYQRASGLGVVPMMPLAGGVPMTGQLIIKEGTATAPGLTFDNDGTFDTGLYHISDGSFGVTCNSVPVANWQAGSTVQRGVLLQTATSANGTTRPLFTGRQSSGTARFDLGISADERAVLVTRDLSGNATGSIYFGNGSVVADGSISGATVTQTSDERKKRHWQRLPADFIAQLAGIRKSGLFQWKKGGQAVGVGAQSLEQILPAAVHTDEAGAKTVNYGAAALVSAVELARAVVDLQARLAKLEAR